MTKTHGAWIWYELMTPDAAASKAFYEAVVPGWTLGTNVREGDGYGFIANADGGMTGGILPITDQMKAGGCTPFWLGYIGVDDVDISLKSVEAAGGSCLMPARDVPMAGRIAMVADCCGAPFYIMTPTLPPGGGESTAFSPTLHGRCAWNDMRTSSAEAAIAFYTSLFGWALPDPMDMGPMGQYRFVAHDGVTVGAIMNKPVGTPPGNQPHWVHYFRVASIDKAIAAIGAHGGAITFGPQDVPGGDRIVHAVDPQGAQFSLTGGR